MRSRIVLTLCALCALIVLVSVSLYRFFYIDSVDASSMIFTLSEERIVLEAERNRSFFKTEGKLESLPYVSKVEFSRSGDILTIQPSYRNGILIADDISLAFYDGEDVSMLEKGDYGRLRRYYVSVSVPSSVFALISSFQADEHAAYLLDLLLETVYNHDLITSVELSFISGYETLVINMEDYGYVLYAYLPLDEGDLSSSLDYIQSLGLNIAEDEIYILRDKRLTRAG